MENKNTLAKVAIAINVVLLILIIVLFTKIGKSDTTDEELKSVNDSDTTVIVDHGVESTGVLAFFNMDSLNSKLLLYSEIEKEIQTSAKNAEQKMRNKQKDIDAWKKKWAKKGQLLSSEQEAYYKDAEKIQNEAMQFEQNVQMKMQQEQEGLMTTYALRISNFAEEFAKENGYDVIFAYQFGQSPWYYNKALDVTDKLAEVMNADFKESSSVNDEE